MKKSKQIKNNRSKKHHYLPRHYLKGFVNSKGGFFIYDKQNGIVLPDPITPVAVFSETNLNTVILPNGEISDFLERLYTDMENRTKDSLDRIRGSNNEMQIELLDKMYLFLFLLFLHWRLPSNIKHVEELSNNFFDKDNEELDYITLINTSGGSVPKEISDKIKDSLAFVKSSKLILAFAPFFNDNGWCEKLNNNWRFLYSGGGNSWVFVGDNPIITKGDNDHDPVNCLNEFVFPISGNILLVNINKPINQDLPPEFVVQFNFAIIERAQRFVACQNKEFLEALIKYYKMYVENNKADSIIIEFFDMLK